MKKFLGVLILSLLFCNCISFIQSKDSDTTAYFFVSFPEKPSDQQIEETVIMKYAQFFPTEQIVSFDAIAVYQNVVFNFFGATASFEWVVIGTFSKIKEEKS